MSFNLWLGSLHSYVQYLEQKSLFDKGLYTTASTGDSPSPDYFELHGNVGVIDVIGPLTNINSIWAQFFGLASYPIIRNGLVEAASHPDVKAIVLNVDSGGGTPNGLPDTSQLIRQISASGVPVYAYTGGMMASAAYWLGSAADQVFAGEAATVGSIGVIATHMDMVDALKQDGITPTVLRAGEFKALANPYEHLSDDAKNVLQAQINDLETIFINRVAEHRGVPVAKVKADMAEGREFIGQKAVKAGLVDGITTLDALVQQTQRKINSSSRKNQSGKETDMAKKKLLTEASVALIQEGVDPALAIEQAGEEVEAPETETPEVETPEPEQAPETEPEAAAPAAPSLEAPAGLVQYLEGQLSAKTNEVIALSTKIAGLETELNAMKATHGQMADIVAASINRMQIGLGGSALDLSSLPPETLLQTHSKLSAQFAERFPVGKTTLAVKEDAGHEAPKVTLMDRARVRAAKV